MTSMLNFLAAAPTTPDAVFKSMGEAQAAAPDINPATVLLVIAAVVGLIVLISTFKKRADRPAQSSVENNPAKLLRQLAREAGLSRREVKELKKLAELQGVQSPLTLLLCPSLMQQAIVKRQKA